MKMRLLRMSQEKPLRKGMFVLDSSLMDEVS